MMVELADDTKLISVEEYLKRPVHLQVWRNLSKAESVKLFVVLNVGQIKVSLRHLLEALNFQLEELFTQWGIATISEKAKRLAGPGRRGRKPASTGDSNGATSTVYRLEYMVNAVMAYVERNPHIKTRSTMDKAYQSGSGQAMIDMGPNIVNHLLDLGNDMVMADFQWACTALNGEISRVYADNPRWRNAISDSDNTLFPLLAGLALSREQYDPAQIEERKQSLLKLLRAAEPGEDVLKFSEPEGESLDYVLSGVKSNIQGRVCRTLVFDAVREYMRTGPFSADTVLNWVAASRR
jgi:hypothetical protein